MFPPENRFRFRRGTPAEWTTKNPILLSGEAGLELTTGHYKIGDGITRWNDLPYYKNWSAIQDYIDEQVADIETGVSGVTQQDLTDHIQSEAPHPVYDDGPSLLVLYNNAKV